MTPLFLRELSIADEQQDTAKTRDLFNRYIPLLYSITAFFSCFICFQTSTLIKILGGDQFSGAVIPMAILSIYPIHQVYGQLSTALFYARSDTKFLRNISIFKHVLGLIMAYLFMAPNEYGGLGMGAIGLTFKMVVVQIIGVNIGLYFNVKCMQLKYSKFVKHQILVLILLISLAWITSSLVNLFNFHFIINFLFSGFLYSIFAGVVAWNYPNLIGLTKDHYMQLIDKMTTYFK